MRKTNVTFLAQTILQLDAGTHEAVQDGGNLYVLIQQSDNTGEEEPVKETVATAPVKATPTPRATAKPAVVVDDTKAVAEKPATRTRAVAKPAVAPAPAPAPEPEADEFIEIPEAEWDTLEVGNLVLAKLQMEGEEGEKMWKAEIIGWKRPKGGKEDKLFVKFLEDGQGDYLREGDRLFEYQEEI